MGGSNIETSSTTTASTSSATASLISITAVPLQQNVLGGVVSETPVLIDIKVAQRPKAEDAADQARASFDLAVVLDRSGSMAGDKLEFSKAAIVNLINNLTADDKIHLVAYDSDITTVFVNGDISDRESLIAQVNAIHANSCTNLFGGLQKGFQIVKESATGSNRQQRVFLFSDGLVNEGLADKNTIFDKVQNMNEAGVSISAFGVGNDFDEALMKGIAESGHGFYFFISAAESIPTAVSKALRGMITTVGTNTLIKLRGKNGCLVKKIQGKSQDVITTGVPLKELKEGDWKRIIVFIEVRPPATFTGSDISSEILSYTVSYLPVVTDNTTTATATAATEEQIQGSVSVTFTEDEAKVTAASNTDTTVSTAVTIASAGDEDRQVLEQIESGQIDEAIESKRRIVRKLEEVRFTDSISDAMYSRAVTTLKTLEERDVVKAKKDVHWDIYMEEEEADMGYGLFD